MEEWARAQFPELDDIIVQRLRLDVTGAAEAELLRWDDRAKLAVSMKPHAEVTLRNAEESLEAYKDTLKQVQLVLGE